MFLDRFDAGRKLAEKLRHYRNAPGTIVLGLARGGVPVAYEIARELHLPLDVFLVRKLGVPGQEELAMGAIATGGVRILNQDIVKTLNLTPEEIEAETVRKTEELKKREALYRGSRPVPAISGQTLILVDDGLATGASMAAAIAALRPQRPAAIVVAIPIGPASTCEGLRKLTDELYCFDTPESFHAVGQGYERFDQTTDSEVRDLLQYRPDI